MVLHVGEAEQFVALVEQDRHRARQTGLEPLRPGQVEDRLLRAGPGGGEDVGEDSRRQPRKSAATSREGWYRSRAGDEALTGPRPEPISFSPERGGNGRRLRPRQKSAWVLPGSSRAMRVSSGQEITREL